MPTSQNYRRVRLPVCFALLLILLGFQSVHAQLQELEINPSSSGSTIPVFTNHPEMAAIIINSSITSLQFESNVGIVEDLSRPNEGYYVLIVRPWRQIITVTAPGYRQSRFTVNATQPREVLYYTAEPKPSGVNILPVNFIVTPGDASIFVNNQQVETGRANQLPVGRHQVRVERTGFRTIDSTIDVSAERTLFTFNLQEVQVTQLVVRSNPEGASLFIGDNNVGTTPYGNFVFPGVYNIRLMLTNYRTFETQIQVTEEGQNIFSFPLERFASELVLDVRQPGARVFLNRQEYTGQQRILLAPGLYRLDVEAEGFERYTEQIELRENQTVNKSVVLVPLTGNLQFSVRPIDAQVQLINAQSAVVERWQGLRMLRNVPVGPYQLQITYPGYQTINDRIAITEGQTTIIEREMSIAPVGGTISVTVNPTTAVVGLYLASGQFIQEWVGNYKVENLPAGNYQLRARAPGFREATQNVTLTAGSNQNVALTLTAAQQATQTPSTRPPQTSSPKSDDLFRYPRFSSINFFFSQFDTPGPAFQQNIDNPIGGGLSVLNFNGWLLTSVDVGYDQFKLTRTASNTLGYEEIYGISLGLGLMPTLGIGSFLVGAGLGVEYNQYENDNVDQAYINTLYYRAHVTVMPRSWSVGFMADYRAAFEDGMYDPKHYQNWSRTTFSLIIKL